MIFDLLIFSLSGSLVFAAVWIMDRSVASSMKTSWRRLWWLLLPVAFLVPVEIPLEVPGSMMSYLNEYKPSSMLSTGPDAAEEAIPEGLFEREEPFSLLMLVPAVFWLAGVAAVLLLACWQTFRAARFWSRKRLCTDPELLGLLEDCKAVAGITAPIGLVVTEDIGSPALMGWLRPRILLPREMSEPASRHLLRPVFFHELAHFRHLDIPLSWLFVLVRAVHWFNPFAHRAAKSWEAFREEAADETSIGWMNEKDGQRYGECLLDILKNKSALPVPQGALSIVETLTTLKRRMTMINHYPSKRPCSTLAIGLACFIFYTMMISLVPAVPGESNEADAAKKQAAAAMESWLKTIDGGGYGQSWTEASAYFKKALTEKKWVAALEAVRTPLGKCKERKLVSALHQTEVPSPDGQLTNGNYVIAQFHSSYENLAQALETVTFEKEADGTWKASGYYIKPR